MDHGATLDHLDGYSDGALLLSVHSYTQRHRVNSNRGPMEDS